MQPWRTPKGVTRNWIRIRGTPRSISAVLLSSQWSVRFRVIGKDKNASILSAVKLKMLLQNRYLSVALEDAE